MSVRMCRIIGGENGVLEDSSGGNMRHCNGSTAADRGASDLERSRSRGVGHTANELKSGPGHLSEKEYYAVAVGDWVRSYPVYLPGVSRKATGRCCSPRSRNR